MNPKDLLSTPVTAIQTPAGEIFSSESLNETIRRAAESWTTTDLETIVTGLREQRSRWNVEQAAGTRKRITSKQIKPEAAKLDAIRKLKISL